MMTNNIILVLSGLTVAATLCEALTLPLIHRHSVMSPIEPTMHGRLTKEVFGEYLMPLSIGTPPVDILANADTGSSLTWIQCRPCTNCYPQREPIFDRRQSSTFQPMLFSEPACKKNPDFDDDEKKRAHIRCPYKVEYGDDSVSEGFIARETMELGDGSSKLRNFIMGCGIENTGKFSQYGSGIVGLGHGRDTFIHQLGQLVDRKFSYCLARKQHDSTGTGGYIKFGEESVVSGRGVVSTPFHLKKYHPHYYLTIYAITIGNVRMPLLKRRHASKTGNMVIDSGASHFDLPTDSYRKVKREIGKQLKEAGAKRIRKARGRKLCYKKSSFQAPRMVLNFEGANVTLKDYNFFLPSRNGNSICSILSRSKDKYGLFGNVAQTDFLIGYDWGEQRVYFKPTDCGATE